MKLLEHVRQTGRVKHFSYRTEKAFAYWAERYFRFHVGLLEGTKPRQAKKILLVIVNKRVLSRILLSGLAAHGPKNGTREAGESAGNSSRR